MEIAFKITIQFLDLNWGGKSELTIIWIWFNEIEIQRHSLYKYLHIWTQKKLDLRRTLVVGLTSLFKKKKV